MEASSSTRLFCRSKQQQDARPERAVHFIHTWGSDGEDFVGLMEELQGESSGSHLKAFDLPGHGNSHEIDEPSVAAFAHRFISQLSTERELVLIAHGDGCRIALEIWRRLHFDNPRSIRIVGLGLLDGHHTRIPQPWPRGWASMTATERDDDAKNDLAFLFAEHHDLPENFATMTYEEQEDEMLCNGYLDDFAQYMYERLSQRYEANTEFDRRLTADLRSYPLSRFDDVMSQISHSGIPVLDLQSTAFNEDDGKRGPVEDDTQWRDYLAYLVPGAIHYVVAESGHWMQHDQEQVVAAMIVRGLLQRVWGHR